MLDNGLLLAYIIVTLERGAYDLPERKYAMDSLKEWMTPGLLAIGIAMMTFMFRMTHKRIDDLRSQMSREHDTLAKKVDNLTEVVTKHISDYSVHKA